MPKQELSRKRVASSDLDSDDGSARDERKQKKSKTTQKTLAAAQKDDQGNDYWEISRTRRLQVSQFKGATMIGIREFYEKDGQTLPGKKGISLSVDQYNAIVELLPAVEASLQAHGHTVKRPVYGGTAARSADADEDAASSEDEKPRRKVASKPNHEATSDEDDD